MPGNVIVFGPTGNVGAVAAQTAQEHGSKVYLAMRDPKKTIPDLSAEQEKAGGYVRIQADLTQPDSVTAAARESKAHAAFIYLMMGSTDGMRSTIEALKAGGVAFVVFLSSFSVDLRAPAAFPPSEVIPYAHAQVELALEDIYGPTNYVALRPGAFATNTLWWKPMFAGSGEVRLLGPDDTFDYITFTDMGRVAGALLARGEQRDGEKLITLFGSRMVPQREAVALISKVIGKELTVKSIGPEEAVQDMLGAGYPEPVVRYIIGARETHHSTIDNNYAYYERGVNNITKFGGKAPTSFEEFLQANKSLYV